MNFYKTITLIVITALLGLMATTVLAVLKIEVTEGTEAGVPIMILPFIGERRLVDQRQYHKIIANDLAYSGLFSIVPPDTETAFKDEEINYIQLLSKGVEKLVVGRVAVRAGKTKIRFSFYDVIQRKLIMEKVISNGANHSRSAHYISDQIYESLTSIPGVFNTRFAFVEGQRLSWRRHKFSLYISDMDGYHAIPIFTSNEQIMSPTWSPDAKQIAYVSYESGQPEIFIQTLASGMRHSLKEHTHVANAPDWSPDGCCIAYVNTVSGNPNVYVINLASKKVTRITKNISIDTEPTWTSDGQLIFTSDRSGSPQLYQTTTTSPKPKRLTFIGKYNTDADVSTDSKQIAFLRYDGSQSMIVRMDMKTGKEQILLTTKDAERPRFAANDHLISHLSSDSVALLTIDGNLGKPISIPVKNVRGLAWSPLLR